MVSPTGIEFYADRNGMIFKKTKEKRVFEQVNTFQLKDGYFVVSCCGRMIPIQRIIAHLFIDKNVIIDRAMNEEERKQQVVHHIDGNKTNNKVTNLKVVTQKENVDEIILDRTCFKIISKDGTTFILGGYRDLSSYLKEHHSIQCDKTTLYNNLNTIGQKMKFNEIIVEIIKKTDSKRSRNKNASKEIIFKDGEYEVSFVSHLDAARFFNIKPSYVYHHIKTGKKTKKIKDHNDGYFYKIMKNEE